MRKIRWSVLCHPLAHLFGIRPRQPRDTRPISDPTRTAHARLKVARAAPLFRPQPEPRASTNNVIPLRTVMRAPKDDPIDSDEEMRGHGPAAKARRRERERCEAILLCEGAHALPEAAKAAAFQTSLTRVEASRLIRALANPEGLPFAHLRPKGRLLHIVAK